MKKVPASPSTKTLGIVYLARMLEKIRLNDAGDLRDDLVGNLGEGFDAKACDFLRVAYPDVVNQVRGGLSDAEVVEWCFNHGWRPSDQEIEIWNEFMRKFGWNDIASERLASRKVESGLGNRDDIQTMFAYIDADEGR